MSFKRKSDQPTDGCPLVKKPTAVQSLVLSTVSSTVVDKKAHAQVWRMVFEGDGALDFHKEPVHPYGWGYSWERFLTQSDALLHDGGAKAFLGELELRFGVSDVVRVILSFLDPGTHVVRELFGGPLLGRMIAVRFSYYDFEYDYDPTQPRMTPTVLNTESEFTEARQDDAIRSCVLSFAWDNRCRDMCELFERIHRDSKDPIVNGLLQRSETVVRQMCSDRKSRVSYTMNNNPYTNVHFNEITEESVMRGDLRFAGMFVCQPTVKPTVLLAGGDIDLKVYSAYSGFDTHVFDSGLSGRHRNMDVYDGLDVTRKITLGASLRETIQRIRDTTPPDSTWDMLARMAQFVPWEMGRLSTL